MSERSLGFWRQLREFADALNRDPALMARFSAAPSAVLAERGLESSLVTGGSGETMTIAEMMEGMSAAEREATIKTLDALGASEDAEETQFALAFVFANAVANANAAANANAGANANTAANANANTNGGEVPIDEGVVSALVLPPDYPGSPLHLSLSEKQLSDVRQRALLTRALTDPSSIVESAAVAGGERRVARYAFRGVAFEVEGIAEGSTIRVTRSSILA